MRKKRIYGLNLHENRGLESAGMSGKFVCSLKTTGVCESYVNHKQREHKEKPK